MSASVAQKGQRVHPYVLPKGYTISGQFSGARTPCQGYNSPYTRLNGEPGSGANPWSQLVCGFDGVTNPAADATIIIRDAFGYAGTFIPVSNTGSAGFVSANGSGFTWKLYVSPGGPIPPLALMAALAAAINLAKAGMGTDLYTGSEPWYVGAVDIGFDTNPDVDLPSLILFSTYAGENTEVFSGTLFDTGGGFAAQKFSSVGFDSEGAYDDTIEGWSFTGSDATKVVPAIFGLNFGMLPTAENESDSYY